MYLIQCLGTTKWFTVAKVPDGGSAWYFALLKASRVFCSTPRVRIVKDGIILWEDGTILVQEHSKCG